MARVDHGIGFTPEPGERWIVIEDLPGALSELAQAGVPGGVPLRAKVGWQGQIKRLYVDKDDVAAAVAALPPEPGLALDGDRTGQTLEIEAAQAAPPARMERVRGQHRAP